MTPARAAQYITPPLALTLTSSCYHQQAQPQQAEIAYAELATGLIQVKSVTIQGTNIAPALSALQLESIALQVGTKLRRQPAAIGIVGLERIAADGDRMAERVASIRERLGMNLMTLPTGQLVAEAL